MNAARERDAIDSAQRRAECRDFMRSNRAVATAAAALLAIAACAQIPMDIHADRVRGQFHRQPKWTSTHDAAYIPSTVQDVTEFIRKVLAGDFDSSPADDMFEHALPSSLSAAVARTAARGTLIVADRIDIAAKVWDIATDSALVAAQRYATDRWSPFPSQRRTYTCLHNLHLNNFDISGDTTSLETFLHVY